MKKIPIYYSFIIVSIMSISGLLGAQNLPELISALLFLPLVVFFGQKIVPKRKKALVLPEAPSIAPQKENMKKTAKLKRVVPEPEMEDKGIDIDRRMFLKLIGSAGLSIFFLSIFTKRAHGAFFGSVPGPGTVALKDTAGVQIDPSQHHPTDGYKISELDDSSPAFYGFVRKDGAWFIMKEDSSGSYRYTKGASGFSTNWTNRAGLAYDYFDAIF